MRVFLDANILFSAAKTAGAVRALIRLLLDSGHEGWVDAYVVAEARRNLLGKDPQSLTALDEVLARLQTAPNFSGADADRGLQWLPAKDRPVLAAAMRLGCDALVTGDRKHFGSAYGKSVNGVQVHSPASLAAMILAGWTAAPP